MADFARQAIIYEDLGKDDRVDILNICFDTPRYVGSKFGPESMEMEDMFYRLDATLAELIGFIKAQYGKQDAVLFVLTSDHGASDSYDAVNPERDRFNVDQFKVIVGTFLNAQYGGDNWVLDYSGRQLYLNRTQAYNMNISLDEMQRQVASFVLQFRGVSHALTASALQNTSFADDYMSRIQNGYYPNRSGDVVINLMPGWIEKNDEIRSSSGSLYDYDTRVPLIVSGCGLPAQEVERSVDMASLPVTLAYIMRINRPLAATAEPIGEVTRYFKNQLNND